VTDGDWTRQALDRSSPIPLYYQLAEGIRARIRSGALPSGSQLPAERDLAERVGISRMTARQALADLVRSGDLAVRQGVGTFVAEPKLTHDALHLLGFTEEMGRVAGPVSSRVIEQRVVLPPPAIAIALDLQPGQETVRIVRLRSAGDAPVLLETSYIPRAICPGLEHEELGSHSLYALLELRYGHRPTMARQTIEATSASVFESELLDVAEDAPTLVLQGVTTTESGLPVEWFQAIYRADRVKIAVESLRETRPERYVAPLSVMLT
jgi:GntR family transcriptional regulator